jgi:cytochrome c553
MRIASAVLIMVALLLAGVSLAQQSPFQSIGTMSQLMIQIIYPTSDDIFYIERNPPSNDREWAAIERSALTLAEAGNLLMMPGRARDQENWIKDSKLLVDAGAAAFRAARAKDMAAIVALNEQLVTSCTTCHMQYRPNYRRRPPQQQQ